MGLQAHFISLDIPLSRRERDKTTISLRSIVALRVAVFDRNLKTRCIRFALAGFVEPSARVRFLFSVKQKGPPKGTLFVSRRERDSNPRSCDRLRISRPAHSTTLASLRGLHNLENNFKVVYTWSTTILNKILRPFEIRGFISTFGRKYSKMDPKNFRFISANALRGFSRFIRNNRHQNHSIVRHGPQMKFTGPEGAL